MRRTIGAVLVTPLLALLLAGCGEPVLVPEAGPGAPGFSEIPAPPPPDVEVVRRAGDPLSPGGAVDSVLRGDGTFTVSGWALLDPEEPRGVLELVLPPGVEAEVEQVTTGPRPDVADATKNPALLWAGFNVVLTGTLPEGTGVCVLSRSGLGEFRLSGSDEGLCPA